MHLEDKDLFALMDGELAPADEARRHMESCASCADRLRALEDLAARNADALATLDTAGPPPFSAQDAIARAGDLEDRADVVEIRRPRRTRFPRAAAAAFLVLAGAAAAMIPGSPVRDPALRLFERLRTPAESPVPAGPEAAVAIEPAARLVVAFAEDQPAGTIEVVYAAGPVARVAAAGGPARFEIGSDSIAVDNRGSSASYVVTVPEGLADVTVLVGDAVAYRRTAGPDPASVPFGAFP